MKYLKDYEKLVEEIDFNRNDINPVNKKTFGELYDKTIEKINILKKHYNLIYKWGI